MNRLQTAGALALIAIAASLGTGCQKLKARDELNKGVAAFKNAKHSEAVRHFQNAISLDPTYSNARLYLATAYMAQWIPGAESPENVQFAKNANDQFLKVLEEDPKNTLAVESLASLHYNEAQGVPKLEDKMKKLDEAKEWYEKLAQMDDKNKTAFYSLGVITWGKWYPVYQEARAKLGMKPEDPGPLKDAKLRQELKAKWGPIIEDGLNSLRKALEIDPNYDDAMAYMNLLIRERADLADSPDEYKKDIETADSWVQKALETKKANAERAAKKNQGSS